MNDNRTVNLLTEAVKQNMEKEIAQQKAEYEKHINRMWRAMVKGFQEVDPLLATKWGVRQPAGFVSKESNNPGLVMHCDNLKLSVVAEFDIETAVYLLSIHKDDIDEIEPLTTVLTPEEIAPEVIKALSVI